MNDLIIQLFLGSDHLINPTLWYLYDTAWIMLLFMAVQKFVRSSRGYLAVRRLLFAISVFLQYCGINFSIWGSFSEDIRYSLGRIVEIDNSCCMYRKFIG